MGGGLQSGAALLTLFVSLSGAVAQTAPNLSGQFPTGIVPRWQAPNDLGEQTIRLPSPVLTIDWDQLFDQTVWGRRIISEQAQAANEQQQENDRIADGLIEEEKALTARRSTLPPAEFQTKAEAFDRRASQIRVEQSAKADALQRRFDGERNAFFDAMVPLLDEALRRRGAVVVLDQRAVIRALPESDVTPDMIALVDARMGDGKNPDKPE